MTDPDPDRPTPFGTDPLSWERELGEFDALVARAEVAASDDPELAALVALARSPLPPLDETIVVPNEVLREVRGHALMAGAHESVGALIARGKVVIDYEPLENLSPDPGRFRVKFTPWLEDGDRAILVHSHPPPGLRTPSSGDLARASRKRLGRPYAIYHVASGTLGMFLLDDDRRGFAWVPVEIVDKEPPVREAVSKR